MQWSAEGPELSGAGNTAPFAGGSLRQPSHVWIGGSTTGGCSGSRRGGVTGHGGPNRVYFRFPGVATTRTTVSCRTCCLRADGTAAGCPGSGCRRARPGSPGTGQQL